MRRITANLPTHTRHLHGRGVFSSRPSLARTGALGRTLRALAITLTVLFTVSGVASAGPVIHACEKPATGALRVAQVCQPWELAIVWNVQGPPGPAGAPGAQGPAGTQGPAGVGVYSDASNNVAAGPNPFGSLTSGTNNVAVGPSMFQDVTTGFNNTAIGHGALLPNTTGDNNSGGGEGALLSNTTGSDNTAFGQHSLFYSTGANDNSAFGQLALSSNTANGNSAFGQDALTGDTSGDGNAALGYTAGQGITTGSYDTLLGWDAGNALTGAATGDIDVGNDGQPGDNWTLRIGTVGDTEAAYIAGIDNTSIAGPANTVMVNSNGQLGTATASLSSEKMDIAPFANDSAAVLRLQPVSYRYKPEYASSVNPTQYGLIAEQVQKVLPDLVQHGRNGQPTGVYYQELPVLLLAEVQHQASEISQLTRENKRLEQLQAEVNELIRATSRH